MTAVDAGGRFTRADWEATPDDGRRYELLDGAIVVTPTPTLPHQRAAQRLYLILNAAVPPDLEVFGLPVNLVLPTGDILEPDLSVLTRDDPDATFVTQVPRLVVESAPRARNAATWVTS